MKTSLSLAPVSSRMGLFDNVRQEMDQMFDRLFHGDNGINLAQPTVWTPVLNLSETESNYQISVDLPGMSADDIDVELRQGDLWITGERKAETSDQGTTWHRIERFHGQFRRVVRLGNDVDGDNVQADFRNGVLHICVPKSELARPKRIEIKH